jgi:hypothetical protein
MKNFDLVSSILADYQFQGGKGATPVLRKCFGVQAEYHWSTAGVQWSTTGVEWSKSGVGWSTSGVLE